jgi:hypothetical protein
LLRPAIETVEEHPNFLDAFRRPDHDDFVVLGI